MTYRFILFIFLAIVYSQFISCKKTEGEGGSATITGKIYVKDYNGSFTSINAQYYATKEDVFIIYGDQVTYGDKVSTNYDGTYEFKYLQKGKYKIYAYSKDSTGAYNGTVNANAAPKAIIETVEISKKKEAVQVPEITILK